MSDVLWSLMGVMILVIGMGLGWLTFYVTTYRKMMHLRDNLDDALRKELELWKHAAEAARDQP